MERSAVGRTASWTIPWTDEVRWECPCTEMFADDITICKWEQPEGGRSSQERAKEGKRRFYDLCNSDHKEKVDCVSDVFKGRT